MKNVLLLMIGVLMSAVVYPQQEYSERISLNWYESDFDNALDTEAALTYMTFDGAGLDAASPEVPRYLHSIDLPADGTLELRVTPIAVSPAHVEREDSRSVITDEYETAYEVVHARGQYQGNISVRSIANMGGALMKLEEFRLDIIFTPTFTGQSRDPGLTTTSVLAQGTWYKIAIPEEGVYKIDGAFLSDELGIDLASLSSQSLQLYGNEGGRLPEANGADQPDDLSEIPLQVVDGGDGNFNSSDFFLFYAEGADRWSYDQEDQTYRHDQNPFDQNNYVFLRTDGSAGKRVSTRSSSSPADYTSDEFDFLQIYEDERTNLLGQFVSTIGTGKEWYGDYFGVENSQTFQNRFDISDLSPLGEAHIDVRFAARGENTTSTRLTVNGLEFSKTASGTSLSDIEREYARAVTFSEDVNLSPSNNRIQIDYTKSIPQDEGWLDYILLRYRKMITGKYGQLRVADSRTIGNNVISLAAPANVTVWDVTDVHNTAIVPASGGQITYESGGALHTFYYISGDSYLTPMAVGPVENQNLHAIDRADLIIVYHPLFFEAASRLGAHRTAHDGYSVQLVNILDVYNEFSSGRQDPTALRDFARMVLTRDQNFRYLLLMGDGSYDYRNITPNLSDHNFVPVYETDESLHPINGFPSDDFYGLLSDNEGANRLRGALDIAVGRIPVTTAESASAIVEKIIRYDTNVDAFGDWRLRIAFAADDEDSNTHVNQADNVAETVEEAHGVFNQSKIYYDAFVQESTPGGARYPGATQAINSTIQNGALLLNYMGHGGPKGWAQERVLKISDIESWNNEDRYPILITATCSFTGYDDPSLVSAGEASIQKEDGGVVALLTTVRAVYASGNERLVKAVFKEVFNKIDGKPQTLGEIITFAKNRNADALNTDNDRKFSLIGDPSQRIAIPSYNVVTATINGKPATEIDTISALEKVTITGLVTDENGVLLSDFNGVINPTVYDKESTLETLANDSGSAVKSFGVYRNVLFKGAATVKNGLFEFSFVMPKDINYEFGKGRISYYAFDGINRDAAGYYNDVMVGGTDPNAVADDEGPQMQLFMNDDRFVSGGSTNPDPILLVDLSDDLGINVSGTSIGHDITAILDENTTNPFILNDFYKASVDDYTRGTVRFPLNDLEVGRHSLRVKAWDVSNNSTEERIEFVVVQGDGESLRNVYNYPNPFSTSTFFMFEHDLVGSDLEVYVDIYTVSGRLIRTVQQDVYSSGYIVDDIEWNARDDYGSRLATGIYLYKIKVISRASNEVRESDFQKMVIL